MAHADDVIRQSKACYAQWAPQWRLNAKEHAKWTMTPNIDFQNSGVGKAALCIANGFSFEENLDVIREMQENVDIMCCDKTLMHCIEKGIKPKFCLVADANVDYEQYMKPIEDQLQDVTLLINVCGNPKWTNNGNWKDRRFFVNKDSCNYEREFIAISGCENVIAAGTNVSNSMVIFLTQCDEYGARNFFGYDKILLIGFDYSWSDSYYAFDGTGNGKTNYMRAIHAVDNRGELCYTSMNLMFSCQWLEKYIRYYRIPAIQCTRRTLLKASKFGDLRTQMGYSHRPEDSQTVIHLLEYRRALEAKVAETNAKLFAIGRDHFKSMIRTT